MEYLAGRRHDGGLIITNGDDPIVLLDVDERNRVIPAEIHRDFDDLGRSCLVDPNGRQRRRQEGQGQQRGEKRRKTRHGVDCPKLMLAPQ